MIKKFKRKDRRKPIDKAIDAGYEAVIDEIEFSGVGDESTIKSIEGLRRLIDIKNSQKKGGLDGAKEILKELGPAAVTGICGIISVWMIVNFERSGIITTKSFPFVPKGRA